MPQVPEMELCRTAMRRVLANYVDTKIFRFVVEESNVLCDCCWTKDHFGWSEWMRQGREDEIYPGKLKNLAKLTVTREYGRSAEVLCRPLAPHFASQD